MKYKTFKKWNDEGYYVLKNEHSRKRNKKSEPVFSEEQVKEKDYNLNESEWLEIYGYNHW